MNNFVIKNKKGTELTSLSAWEQGFIEVDDKKHWETGYSAYSLAQFFTERDGQQWLSNLMSDIFNDSFTITDARIEHESKLDTYSGKHRMQDLAIWGSTGIGKKVFCGVEAKVLESFGNNNLRDEYEAATHYQKYKKPNSKRPDRIKETVKFLFEEQTPYSEGICNLRYQLMYYFRASIMETPTYESSKLSISKRNNELDKVDVVVLPVLVFITDHYNSDTEKGNLNENDFANFCDALGLKTIQKGGKDFRYGKIHGREVYTFYEKITL